MKTGAYSDIMNQPKGTVGDDMKVIAIIRNKEVFERWKKTDPIVVLTDERIEHIKSGHLQDYIELGDKIGEAIEYPSYILEDAKNHSSAMFIKKITETNMNVIVKMKIDGVDGDDLHSSVITMYKLGEKTLKRLIKKNKILYKAR